MSLLALGRVLAVRERARIGSAWWTFATDRYLADHGERERLGSKLANTIPRQAASLWAESQHLRSSRETPGTHARLKRFSKSEGCKEDRIRPPET